METKALFEKVLKDNEIIKGQLNNLQTSIQLLKNNMAESQNNKNNFNFSSLLDNLTISSSNEEINPTQNQDINSINEQNKIQEPKENKNKNNNNNVNNKYIMYKGLGGNSDNKALKNNYNDNIHKRNIKKLLKEKEVINKIYLLKENYNNYNNYNIYNRSSIESSTKRNNNNDLNEKIMLCKELELNKNNTNHNKIKNSSHYNKNYLLNSAKKTQRTNSMININISKSNKKNKNISAANKFNNNKKANKLRHSYDDYYNKNSSYIENNKSKNNNAINKRSEILNYLKEINNLQNIISQLKKENEILKSSLYKEKQKNKKFRKLTEEIINQFENLNNK